MPVAFGVDIGNRSPMMRRIAAIGFVTAGVCVLPYFLHLWSGRGARQTRRELWTSVSIAAFLVGIACAVKVAGTLGEPRPYIDIWDQVQGATGMLKDGINPYTTPNAAAIATGKEHGYPTVTFPYTPTILLLTTAANRWLTDPRYLFVLSDLLAAILLFRISAAPELTERTKRYCRIGALLIVFHPNSFAKMWNDLLIIPLLVAMTLSVMRASRSDDASPYGAAVVAGFAIGTKQYLVTLVPLFVVWLRRPKALGVAAVAGILTAVPFLIWDAAALWQSTFAFHLKTPFRHDSMSLASFTYHVFGELPPRWLGFAALAVFLAGGVWAVKRRGFVALCAWSPVALLWLFGLGQHTFHNYYHGVVGFLLWGGLALAIENDAPPLLRGLDAPGLVGARPHDGAQAAAAG